MAIETDMAKRLRSMIDDIRYGLVEVENRGEMQCLLEDAAKEVDRYYNGMMNWKATAEAKDRDYVSKVDKESKL